MSDPVDPFEADLAALRPLTPSPRLRRRVAGRLTGTPTRRWAWRLALAGAVAAAGGLAVVAPWRPVTPPPRPPAVAPPPPAAADQEDTTPALLAYRRALARSPEELDARLDRAATAGQTAGSMLLSHGVYARSSSALTTLFGDD